jgi:hypothetical protein
LAIVKAQARDLRAELALAQLRVSELEMALDLARSKAMEKE